MFFYERDLRHFETLFCLSIYSKELETSPKFTQFRWTSRRWPQHGAHSWTMLRDPFPYLPPTYLDRMMIIHSYPMIMDYFLATFKLKWYQYLADTDMRTAWIIHRIQISRMKPWERSPEITCAKNNKSWERGCLWLQTFRRKAASLHNLVVIGHKRVIFLKWNHADFTSRNCSQYRNQVKPPKWREKLFQMVNMKRRIYRFMMVYEFMITLPFRFLQQVFSSSPLYRSDKAVENTKWVGRSCGQCRYPNTFRVGR